MHIKEPLGENSDGNDATGHNRPHQQAALLDVIDHAFFLTRFETRGKLTTQCELSRAIGCTSTAYLDNGTYRFVLSRGLGDGEGRAVAAPVRLSILPEASKTE